MVQIRRLELPGGRPHRGRRTGRRRGEVHIILDNLSAHKSQVVRDFLATHPNVHFHFTPTYSSWLNQVEIWFSKVERDLIPLAEALPA